MDDIDCMERSDLFELGSLRPKPEPPPSLEPATGSAAYVTMMARRFLQYEDYGERIGFLEGLIRTESIEDYRAIMTEAERLRSDAAAAAVADEGRRQGERLARFSRRVEGNQPPSFRTTILLGPRDGMPQPGDMALSGGEEIGMIESIQVEAQAGRLHTVDAVIRPLGMEHSDALRRRGQRLVTFRPASQPEATDSSGSTGSWSEHSSGSTGSPAWPRGEIRFQVDDGTILMLDSRGFHYNGRHIPDAGAAHTAFMEFMARANNPMGMVGSPQRSVDELAVVIQPEASR